MNKKWGIAFNNVGLIYPNGKEALKNINLKINSGEFVGIIGLSGAGKTTLLKTINKLNDITSGEIIVGDIDGNETYEVSKLSGKHAREYKSNIGMVFQRYNLIYKSSVLTNVLSSRLNLMPTWRALIGLFSEEDKMNGFKALEQVNMMEYAYSRAEELSGGQMQRVALARTIAQEASIILADEPVGALDPIMAKSVMDSFLKVNKQNEVTILINLHHVDLALQYTDRIIGVRDGEICFDGKAEDITLDILKHIYGKELEGFDEFQLKEIWRKRKIIKDFNSTGDKDVKN